MSTINIPHFLSDREWSEQGDKAQRHTSALVEAMQRGEKMGGAWHLAKPVMSLSQLPEVLAQYKLIRDPAFTNRGLVATLLGGVSANPWGFRSTISNTDHGNIE